MSTKKTTTKKKAVAKKKTVKKAPVTKKVAVKKKPVTTKKKAPVTKKKVAVKRQSAPAAKNPLSITQEERYDLICKAAYAISIKRSPHSCDAEGDWVHAEAVIDAIFTLKP